MESQCVGTVFCILFVLVSGFIQFLYFLIVQSFKLCYFTIIKNKKFVSKTNSVDHLLAAILYMYIVLIRCSSNNTAKFPVFRYRWYTETRKTQLVKKSHCKYTTFFRKGYRIIFFCETETDQLTFRNPFLKEVFGHIANSSYYILKDIHILLSHPIKRPISSVSII